MQGPYTLRAMHARDIESIVDIIELHDDDDALAAYHAFHDFGTDGHQVLVDGDDIARGVIGLFQASEITFWLSWTYLDMRLRGQGFGRKLSAFMLEDLREKGGTLLFISTSDYKVRGLDIYEDAKRFYRKMGAEEVMKISDYYQRGETHCVFRMQVDELPARDLQQDPLFIQFVGMEPIKETKVAYGLQWEETTFEHLERIERELEKLVAGAKYQRAHAVFFSVPSDFDDRQRAIVESFGFQKVGTLHDYFASGVDEIHFAYYF